MTLVKSRLPATFIYDGRNGQADSVQNMPMLYADRQNKRAWHKARPVLNYETSEFCK